MLVVTSIFCAHVVRLSNYVFCYFILYFLKIFRRSRHRTSKLCWTSTTVIWARFDPVHFRLLLVSKGCVALVWRSFLLSEFACFRTFGFEYNYGFLIIGLCRRRCRLCLSLRHARRCFRRDGRFEAQIIKFFETLYNFGCNFGCLVLNRLAGLLHRAWPFIPVWAALTSYQHLSGPRYGIAALINTLRNIACLVHSLSMLNFKLQVADLIYFYLQ